MDDTRDRAENTAEDLKGKVKEHVGDMTDNERLEAEGKAEQARAAMDRMHDKAENAADDAKDTVEGAVDGFRRD
jgi:uncharacterized protein YjbJ (UPF0337 family)